MPVNSWRQIFMLEAFGCNSSQGLDYPLLLRLDELADVMLGDIYWRDHFDFTGRYDNSRLRGPRTAPNLVRKFLIKNDCSLYYKKGQRALFKAIHLD